MRWRFDAMPDKARLGNRYTCYQCGCRFYDLNKPAPVCPRCGADQQKNPAPDPRTAALERYKNTKATARAQRSFDVDFADGVDDFEGQDDLVFDDDINDDINDDDID